MKIRKAHRSDIGKIYQLSLELNEATFNKNRFKELLQKELDDPSNHYLLALEDLKLIGYLDGQIENRLCHDKTVAIVKGLVVSAGNRGKGIGTELFNAFEEIAKKNDCGKIEVASSLDRKDAHRFYTGKAGMLKTHYRFSKKL